MIVTYQPVLVLLSIGVAILGSLTALALTSLSDDSDAGAGQQRIVLTCGGLIMGATIWSMHFVAMMAVDFPVIVTYNLIETVGSIGIAIIGVLALLAARGDYSARYYGPVEMWGLYWHFVDLVWIMVFTFVYLI